MKNVLIVGASSSVGIEISSYFRTCLMSVIATYSSSPSKVAGEFPEALHLDLTSDESIRAFRSRLNKTVKTLDIIIFLPAVLLGKKLSEYGYLEIDHVMSVNVSGQLKLIQELLPLLHSDSRLLLFSSISGQRGSFDSVYAASKGATLALVKSLIRELPSGARINAIAPGLIQDSEMFKKMEIERRKYHKDQIPSGELLNSQDLAKIVFDLCQDHWRHLNGACIDLNGGQYVR